MSMDIGVPGIVEAEPIGHGSFGSVYKARQPQLNRTVAVKIFHASESDGVDLQSFERECAAIGQFDWSPNIVTVFSAGATQHGKPFIVMEYAPGGTLADRVRNHGPLPEIEVVEIATALAGALVEAHAAGVLHRDIKPANILFSKAGNPLLADFGISRTQDSAKSITGTGFAGTVAYGAPEVLEGIKATPQSDLFSLGATLYALLTGHSPFASDTEPSLSAMITKAITGPEIDLSELNLTTNLHPALQGCLARNPADRFSSAEEMLASLLGGESPRTPGQYVAPLPSESSDLPRSPLAAAIRSIASEANPDRGTELIGRWPTPTDYVAAIQSTEHPLTGLPELAEATTTPGILGMPVSITGQSVIAFELQHSLGRFALRCFTRKTIDAARRYQAVTHAADQAQISELTPAAWVGDLIRVEGQTWPAVLMPWVAGDLLSRHIENSLDDADKLRTQAKTWVDLVSRMHRAGIAHGDLQPGNVIMEGDSFHLIDLDGCFVPGDLAAPDETGHPNFQHPGRRIHHWGPEIDGFSILVIYLSFLALAASPDLWDFHTGENLILSKNDYSDPLQSQVIGSLRQSADPEVRRLIEVLIGHCLRDSPPTTNEVLNEIQGVPASKPMLTKPPKYSDPTDSIAGATVVRPTAPASPTNIATPGFAGLDQTVVRSAEPALAVPSQHPVTEQNAPPARPELGELWPLALADRARWWNEAVVAEMSPRRRMFGKSQGPIERTGSYEARIDRVNPASICILIDQSHSMNDWFAQSQKSKADVVAEQVNRLIYELILRCVKSPQQPPLPYFYVSVIGYGGYSFDIRDIRVTTTLDLPSADEFGRVSTTELAANPSAISMVADPNSGRQLQMPTWVEANAFGGTPMCTALNIAGAAAADWIWRHPTGYPPIVINLTDGEATDGDPLLWARRLRSLSTHDGQALLFNVNVSGRSAIPNLFPKDPSQIYDRLGRTLYEMSSPLPVGMLASAKAQGLDVDHTSRAFACNADVNALALFLNIGTSVGRVG